MWRGYMRKMMNMHHHHLSETPYYFLSNLDRGLQTHSRRLLWSPSVTRMPHQWYVRVVLITDAAGVDEPLAAFHGLAIAG